MTSLIHIIRPAILDSRKIRVSMQSGDNLIVQPHIVVRKKHGFEILKTMLDNGECMDIPLVDIRHVAILPESFALDSSCLSYDYDEYELVFPKREDWLQFKAETPA